MDVDLPRWKPLNEYMRRFERDYCGTAMPPLRVQPASDRLWTPDEYQKHKPRGFPATLRGIYVLYDTNEALLYIGVATGCFDQRVWSHDDWSKRRYIDIIVFKDRWLPLSLALEYYLIVALNPPENSVFRTRGLPPNATFDPITSS